MTPADFKWWVDYENPTWWILMLWHAVVLWALLKFHFFRKFKKQKAVEPLTNADLERIAESIRKHGGPEAEADALHYLNRRT